VCLIEAYVYGVKLRTSGMKGEKSLQLWGTRADLVQNLQGSLLQPCATF